MRAVINKIEILRDELYKSIEINGFIHDITIQKSMELDKCLNIYQQLRVESLKAKLS